MQVFSIIKDGGSAAPGVVANFTAAEVGDVILPGQQNQSIVVDSIQAAPVGPDEEFVTTWLEIRAVDDTTFAPIRVPLVRGRVATFAPRIPVVFPSGSSIEIVSPYAGWTGSISCHYAPAGASTGTPGAPAGAGGGDRSLDGNALVNVALTFALAAANANDSLEIFRTIGDGDETFVVSLPAPVPATYTDVVPGDALVVMPNAITYRTRYVRNTVPGAFSDGFVSPGEDLPLGGG